MTLSFCTTAYDAERNLLATAKYNVDRAYRRAAGRLSEYSTVNGSDGMARETVELCHAFDLRKRDFVALVKQMTHVRRARHQTLLILTTHVYTLDDVSQSLIHCVSETSNGGFNFPPRLFNATLWETFEP